MDWPPFSVSAAGKSYDEATFKVVNGIFSCFHSAFLTSQDSENVAKITWDMQFFYNFFINDKVDPVDWMLGTLRSASVEARKVGRTIIVVQEDWLSRVGGRA
ncbi:MAG: hypothetical protein PHE24_05245 [Patescibacteria group bacterium]|nr:hypothetical protein [Patescibacteria group bacterium]